uniref:Thioredoxin domain-containing protein n=1 Tax=Hemiselmis tepida TaxID=464990 RepID=A0A7S0YH40_9CRYP|mmetsp:Transcript_10288/g.26649  ORF Transcript_10288/g.26649 Transcript_10288/m.26649 type:complete len:482 (+) Transcript_10288:80-1525(+)|eukprot:CAMPEP_0174940290 /NCGR_PEP_ID=MMETSP1355-20121228/68726_1 /TAXON_ID=464990 /ORGANISM="Hemiselmis tepida, Strain CCMP443" /LENGTH=481 /DNA_ID=CAMNT_0016187341 /DNA_START=53 /DNA_END=1498 /DNA_ORIENTATION=+
MTFSFKSLDFFRRVKRELVPEITEVSWSGSVLSVLAAIGMLFLFYTEFVNFTTIETESRLLLDKYKDPKDDTLQLNFNMDFPHLKCDFAKISATNFMGTHMAGMALRINKVHLDMAGKAIARHEERKKPLQHSQNEVHEGPVATKGLTEEKFHSTLQDHSVTLVSFCVSNYIWCDMLDPVWEKSAVQLSDEKALGSDYLMAKVNCSDPSAAPLCREEGVDTYPSIRVYRKGAQGKEHEAYHGERSVAAITAWASHIIQQGHDVPAASKVVDADADGSVDSHNGVGCRMSGTLKVQKAPGMIRIKADSDGHAFDWTTMDVSHTVTHMSFGPPPPGHQDQVTPPHIKDAVGAMNGKQFSSAKDVPTTHEHMLKVVPHRIVLPHARWSTQSQEQSVLPPMEGFSYVFHSNNLQKVGEVPEVRLNYDILPYTMQFWYKQDTLYDFLTQICAIVGGVFVVSGIVWRILDKVARFVAGGPEPGKMPY